MSELIAGTDDEIFEGIVGIQVGAEQSSVFGTSFMRGTSHELIRGVFEDVFDFE